MQLADPQPNSHGIDITGAKQKPSTARKALSVMLLLGSGVWIGVLIARSEIDLEVFDGLQPILVLAAFTLGGLSLGSKAIVFAWLVKRRAGQVSTREAVGVFLVSQVVRYLPGRVWGLVYSVARLGERVSQRSVWWASVEQFLITNLNSIAVGALVVGWHLGSRLIGLVSLVTVWALVVIALRRTSVTSLVARLRKPNVGLVRSSSLRSVPIFAALQLDWLFYFGAWLTLIGSTYRVEDTLFLSVAYALAWLVGLIAVIVPAGLVIREASFIWLAGLFGFSVPELLPLAAGARIFFLAIELVGFAVGALLQRDRSTVAQSHEH